MAPASLAAAGPRAAGARRYSWLSPRGHDRVNGHSGNRHPTAVARHHPPRVKRGRRDRAAAPGLGPTRAHVLDVRSAAHSATAASQVLLTLYSVPTYRSITDKKIVIS